MNLLKVLLIVIGLNLLPEILAQDLFPTNNPIDEWSFHSEMGWVFVEDYDDDFKLIYQIELTRGPHIPFSYEVNLISSGRWILLAERTFPYIWDFQEQKWKNIYYAVLGNYVTYKVDWDQIFISGNTYASYLPLYNPFGISGRKFIDFYSNGNGWVYQNFSQSSLNFKWAHIDGIIFTSTDQDYLQYNPFNQTIIWDGNKYRLSETTQFEQVDESNE